MEALLQRLTDSMEERARRVPAGARWTLWIVLLILPGSFLLLPLLIWAKLTPPRRDLGDASDPAQVMRSGSSEKPLAG
ncbi:MAG: hypothetical protein JNK68_09725 [Betaproteobacteria bacterium]|nr:hypothetical protein [Betaproteobacteria bacterium]